MIVGQFLDWMETAPAGRRADAAHALARAYLYSSLDDETRSSMEAAMTLLLDDPAPEVRLALADALGASPDAPRHVIVALAADLPAVAVIVLQRSPVLIDAELVDMVAVADESLQSAIAARPVMSAAVAAALAEVGARRACLELVANPTAALPPVVQRRLAERMGDDPDIRNILLDRSDLPPDVHHILTRQLGDALGVWLAGKAWVKPERARRVVREACDRAAISIAGQGDETAAPVLVQHLRGSGQLTTELLLRAVCCGQISVFESALANLTGMPLDRVSPIVRGRRLAPFRAIYAKAGLPESAFDAFVCAAQAWREVEAEGAKRDRFATTMQVINAVTKRYASRTGDDMTDMAAVLRRFAADQARDAARDYARPATPHRRTAADRAAGQGQAGTQTVEPRSAKAA